MDKQRTKEYYKAYKYLHFLTNREKYRELKKAWRIKNYERYRANNNKYIKTEKAKQSRLAWRQANREKVCGYSRKYRATHKPKPRQNGPYNKRQYYLTHKTKLDRVCAEWKKKNPEKRKATLQKYNNTRKRKEYMRQWVHAHPDYRDPEKVRVSAQIRRARVKGSPGSHTPEQWLARVAYYGWRCAYCGIMLIHKTLTQDHRIPLRKGGSNWPANLVPVCQHCNATKNAKLPHQFAPVSLYSTSQSRNLPSA